MSMLSMKTVLLAAVVVAAPLSVFGAVAGETVSLTLKDHAFTPAEVKVKAGEGFTLAVHNGESAAAEIESKRLHIEKVVTAGQDITVDVKPQKAGKYLIVDEYHEDVAKAYIIVE